MVANRNSHLQDYRQNQFLLLADYTEENEIAIAQLLGENMKQVEARYLPDYVWEISCKINLKQYNLGRAARLSWKESLARNFQNSFSISEHRLAEYFLTDWRGKNTIFRLFHHFHFLSPPVEQAWEWNWDCIHQYSGFPRRYKMADSEMEVFVDNTIKQV